MSDSTQSVYITLLNDMYDTLYKSSFNKSLLDFRYTITLTDDKKAVIDLHELHQNNTLNTVFNKHGINIETVKNYTKKNLTK